MIDREFINILCCPICKGELGQISEEKLKCLSCKKKYDIISGIPVLLSEERAVDNKWSQYYNKLKNQPTLLSGEIKKENEFYIPLSFRQIKPYLTYPKGSYFLEAGCGLCIMGIEIAKLGYRIIGLDNNLDALTLAKAHFKKQKIKGLFVQGNLVKLPFRDNSCDFVYSNSTIEHIKETSRVVGEFFRILSTEGRAFNTVPYASLATIIYRMRYGNIPQLPIWRKISEFIHYKLLNGKFAKFGLEKSYTMKQMKQMFENAGFKLIHVGKFEVYLELNGIRFKILQDFFRKLASKSKLFWPIIKIIAEKKR